MDALPTPDIGESRLADRLRALRAERRWALDALADKSGVSRASLSRIENGEVSPTAATLGRLAAAFGLSMSRLLAEVEADAPALVACAAQPEWVDPATGFRRRSVSPPAPGFACEMLECELPPHARVAYPLPPHRGMEHHLYLLEGALELMLGDQTFRLHPGDCLRYRLMGASAFHALGDAPAHYILAIR